VLAGAVLAGGSSRRYGRNKAMEVFHGERLIDRAVNSLRTFCDPVMVVANDLSLYYDVRATLVRDIVPHQGPLGGIYSALLFSPHDWVLAKATDMPFLVPELVTMMLGKRSGYDVVVPMLNQLYEPLLALYSRRCMPSVAALMSGEQRKITNLYKLYNKVRIGIVHEEEWRLVDPEGMSFKNVNTPADWEYLPWN
jgi:molybdopterin-guanine dinucleotide biosynthesis protein A